jgi:hypothetical protein
MNERPSNVDHAVLVFLLILYCAASLLHFVHNAVYLSQYPNLPLWLTSAGVYWAWLGITAVGAIGYGIYCRVSQRIGLAIIACYALLGFGGLDHYFAAPMSAHSATMNATIWIEAAGAAVLLPFVIRKLLLIRMDDRNAGA